MKLCILTSIAGGSALLAASAFTVACKQKSSGWRFEVAEAIPLSSNVEHLKKELGEPISVVESSELLKMFVDHGNFKRNKGIVEPFEEAFDALIHSKSDEELVESDLVDLSSYGDFAAYSIWYWQLPTSGPGRFDRHFLRNLPDGTECWIYTGATSAWFYFVSKEKIVMKSRITPWNDLGVRR